jgi:hypothetical protein
MPISRIEEGNKVHPIASHASSKSDSTNSFAGASSTAHNRKPATGKWDEREERRMDTE